MIDTLVSVFSTDSTDELAVGTLGVLVTGGIALGSQCSRKSHVLKTLEVLRTQIMYSWQNICPSPNFELQWRVEGMLRTSTMPSAAFSLDGEVTVMALSVCPTPRRLPNPKTFNWLLELGKVILSCSSRLNALYGSEGHYLRVCGVANALKMDRNVSRLEASSEQQLGRYVQPQTTAPLSRASARNVQDKSNSIVHKGPRLAVLAVAGEHSEGSGTPGLSQVSKEVDNQPIALRKSGRARRLPARYVDNGTNDIEDGEDQALPERLAPMEPTLVNHAIATDNVDRSEDTCTAQQPPEANGDSRTPLPSLKWWSSKRNKFRLWRRYLARNAPTQDPEQLVQPSDLDDAISASQESAVEAEAEDRAELMDKEPQSNNESSQKQEDKNGLVIKPLGPFPNASAFELANCYFKGCQDLSIMGFHDLLNVLRHPQFSLADAINPNWNNIISSFQHQEKPPQSSTDDGLDEWVDNAGWQTTPITIQVPFHKTMQGRGIEEKEVGTLHHRNILLVLAERVRSATDGPHFHYELYELHCDVEVLEGESNAAGVHVHGELYTSDAFVEAHRELQLSPPVEGCNLEQVIAALMFSSNSTNLTDFGPAKLWPCYMFFGNESKYCRSKPSLHLGEHIAYLDTWEILLGDNLVSAMKDGIVLMCHNGIERRFYPRIFTYSADYPEKVLIGLIKQNRSFPCPQCLVPKPELQNMGTPDDLEIRADNLCNNDQELKDTLAAALKDVASGYSVIGDVVNNRLKSRSTVPIKNAFHLRLEELDFSVFPCLVVDLLHKFEIGVWKNMFIHLLRLMHSLDCDMISELDKRNYSQIYIQCIGNEAQSCLRLRGSSPIETCQRVATYELPHEVQARLQREKGQRSTNKNAGPSSSIADSNIQQGPLASRRQKAFNLTTYKYHTLADYPSAIRSCGTTDSYTTDIGEKSHRNPKKWARMQCLKKRRMAEQVALTDPSETLQQELESPCFPGSTGPSRCQYFIGTSTRFYDLDLHFAPVEVAGSDPALANFLPKLKIHLLPRLLKVLAPGLYSPKDLTDLGAWINIVLDINRIYHHQILQLKYTTYDVCREEDIIHMGTDKCDIMTLDKQSGKSTGLELYKYGCIIGIFSSNVMFVGTFKDSTHCYDTRLLKFLWVRWFQPISATPGPGLEHLDNLKFYPLRSDNAFGFLDPSEVIRAVHIIPRFASGPRTAPGDPLKKSGWIREEEDWNAYYVNRFVDRDMFMHLEKESEPSESDTATITWVAPPIGPSKKAPGAEGQDDDSTCFHPGSQAAGAQMAVHRRACHPAIDQAGRDRPDPSPARQTIVTMASFDDNDEPEEEEAVPRCIMEV
ncbi:hypothetical protein FA15DRAFT_661464 [Coprinopsis marcescibilis]|uniref:Uncharacterized protein n=1 Tax=Coprinopsis marcescibilis TaxID=230819 RepID=A0A5C3KBW8_COPMA|nr:hypothetical protein FA15DRAFT_661464 [Coprinopsis marcescibilis]